MFYWFYVYGFYVFWFYALLVLCVVGSGEFGSMFVWFHVFVGYMLRGSTCCWLCVSLVMCLCVIYFVWPYVCVVLCVWVLGVLVLCVVGSMCCWFR